jgi:tetratricopeptide (TPR) repeat protein
MTGGLVRQGNELASSGELANALDKYETAAATDPYDPDPHYQSGACLLELGAYKNGREAFEEVERLAPGWFHSRTGRWLAKSLEEGTVTDEQFRTFRGLVDGGLAAKVALGIARQAVDRHPDFAPLYLALGDLERTNQNPRDALAAYRRGLALVEEPDLETRLLAAVIGTLPPESEEKAALIERALSLDGNLVARASVILMNRMRPK